MCARSRMVLLCMTAALCLAAGAFAGGIEEKMEIKAGPFNLKQVKLLDGPFKEAMQRDLEYLYALDSDRLLHMFRVTAGLPSEAEPLGGWEDPACELRGHTLGHFLSACALMYASTVDSRVRAKAEAIVAELAKCQEALAKKYNPGYLFAFPESFFDRVDALKPVWVPWYTCHKIMAGLLDLHQLCGCEQALEILEKMAAWVKWRTDRLDEEHMQRTLDLEFGGMPEVLADLYAVTKNPDHLALARRFDHRRILDPLSRQEDRLKGLHVNTQLPKIVGAAREGELTGNPYYQEVATFFWDQVTRARCYATGGTSNYEHWRTDPNVLASELSVESQETCCTYNMLKLTRHLFSWNPEARYMDYYERALFNGILATQSPENGMMMYYVAMKPGHFKVFSTPNDSFWCCTGTGMENHAKYGESIYAHDRDGLYVNLFIASQLLWPERGMRVRQDTRFPEQQGTLLTIKTASEVFMTLRIRVPYWAVRGVQLKINGQKEDVDARPASYLAIERTWKNGDQVEVSLPMSLHLHRMPDDPNLAAVMYGPLVLAGELGTEKFSKDMQYVKGQRDQHHAPSIEVPAFVVEDKDLESWIRPVKGRPLTFRTEGAGRPADVTLSPFHRLFDQRYSVYWRFYTEDAWNAAEAERREREARDAERLRMLAERAVSSVEIGGRASEEAHGLQGERTRSGIHLERAWRDAADGGWFSYEMAVEPDEPMTLFCTYWGDDVGRTFRVMVEGQEIARQELDRNRPGEFFDQEYPVPVELTQGKEKVTVRFEGLPGNIAGGVFGLAMLK